MFIMHDIIEFKRNEWPINILQIADPPKRLNIVGKAPNPDTKILCIVGSRKHTSYGEEITKYLIRGIAGYNICIVSGLAFGIDYIAHTEALEVGLQTIAFPGSGLDQRILYPQKHKKLAEMIVRSGGGLISEYDNEQVAFEWTFPRRNRLMAGVADTTIVIEAGEKSGTLITARLANEYNRNVGAVPGDIRSPLSFGPNNLIKDGAIPITSPSDILEVLGFPINNINSKPRALPNDLSDVQKTIMELLMLESASIEKIFRKTGVEISTINQNISRLEIKGYIKEKNGLFSVTL